MTNNGSEVATAVRTNLVQAVRTTNALLVAQALGLDMTNPVEAQRVLREMAAVENYVRGFKDD